MVPPRSPLSFLFVDRAFSAPSAAYSSPPSLMAWPSPLSGRMLHVAVWTGFKVILSVMFAMQPPWMPPQRPSLELMLVARSFEVPVCCLEPPVV